MLDFITSSNGPLGTVEHYAWRREYQSRGLQHFHLLLWIKDAPILGKANLESIAEFINKYITCRIPNKSNFPLLHDRVIKYQIHKHNSYCMRAKTVKNKTIRVCRFSFPREISEYLHVNEVADAVIGRRKLTKTRLYNLPRNDEELNINDYNPVIMLAWCGNVDIQFIGEKSASLTTYITKYQTKAEKSFASDDFSDFCSTKPLYSRLWNFGLRTLSNRECGALEAADTLLSHSLFGTDSGTVIRWLDVKIHRSRKLKNQNELLKLSTDATDIYCSSWIDTHYPRRPKQLENLSLFDFSRWYDIVDKKPCSETVVTYEYGGKHLRKRKIPYLINHYNYNSKEQPENYYFCLLILFKPWRTTSELKGHFNTYTESFIDCKDALMDAMKYHERLEEIQQAKSDLDSKIETIEKQMFSNSHDDDDNFNIINFVEPIGNEIEEFEKLVSKEDIDSMIAHLNVDQKRVFDEVVCCLEKYIKELNTCTSNNDNVNKRLIPNKILRKFVSGIGGTGKSYLIKVIRCYISNKFNKVAVTAPTGIAAFNINGLTIHRLLQLPVEHGNIPKYSKLSDDKLNSIRAELNNLVLLILDEVSMVSNVMLMHIHMRLAEIFDTMDEEDGWFGRINILFFGDLLQLPPVMGDSPFVDISRKISTTHFSGLHFINIWQKLFTYDELSINMRQQTDKVYASILDSIRVGVLTDADELILRKREIVIKSKNPSACMEELVEYVQKLECKTICLFPTKKQCHLFNAAMLKYSSNPKVILKAIDIIQAKTKAQKDKALKSLNRIKEDNSRTASLEDKIEVKLGAKIMLLRNIDITNGLVNGAIGFIVKIYKDHFSTENISKLRIKFATGEFDIEPVTAKFQLFTNVFVFRKQFPICLAYGITIHKSQGLTLDTCVVDIGSSIFSSGQVYVALSRVKCLDGLHIINLNPYKIQAQNSAILEYNRLKYAFNPDLKLFSLDKTFNKDVPDKNIYLTHLHTHPLIDIQNAQIKKHGTDIIGSLSHFHGFNNPHAVSCYANAILQCLFNIECINSAIMLSPHSELKKLCLDFSSPTSNAALDCYQLREQFHDDALFDINQQQDSTEFLQLLLDEYNYLKFVMSFDTKTYYRCQNCDFVKQDAIKTQIGKVTIPVAKNKFKFEELLEYNFNNTWNSDFCKEARCPNCKHLNVLTTRTKIENTQNVLVFSLQLINSNMQKNTKLLLSGVHQSKITFCDQNYTLSGAIFHTGSHSKGHYTAIVRKNKHWFKADDAMISKCSWPRNSKDIYILFFEKT